MIEDEDEKKEDDIMNTYTDTLREDVKERKREAFKIIVDTVKLIAPVIEDDAIEGYEFILEQLK